MDSKYQNKFERELIEDDFKFCRLVNGYGLYRKWNGEVVIARVTDKGNLEVLLHANVNDETEKENE